MGFYRRQRKSHELLVVIVVAGWMTCSGKVFEAPDVAFAHEEAELQTSLTR